MEPHQKVHNIIEDRAGIVLWVFQREGFLFPVEQRIELPQ
jgi:hypothetical protein